MAECYISTDIETDGPLPGPNSMLSFGSAAFVLEGGKGKLINTFSRNLIELPEAAADPKTKTGFWDKNPKAWEACRENPVAPVDAMWDYVAWIGKMPGRPVFVGYPATFDFLFMYTYLLRFTGASPFSFSALDVKSYAMAKLGTGFRETTKRNMPKAWFPPSAPHTHVALEDAIEQGWLFMNILAWKPPV